MDLDILFTLRLYCRVKPWLQTGHQTLLFLTLPAAGLLELRLSLCCCCCMCLLATCALFLALTSTKAAAAAFTSEGCAVARWLPRTAASWKTSLQR